MICVDTLKNAQADRVVPRSHCKSNKPNRFLLLPTRCCTQGTTCANLDQCAVSDAKEKRKYRYREVLENLVHLRPA